MNGEKHLVARLQHDLHSGIQPPKQKNVASGVGLPPPPTPKKEYRCHS